MAEHRGFTCRMGCHPHAYVCSCGCVVAYHDSDAAVMFAEMIEDEWGELNNKRRNGPGNKAEFDAAAPPRRFIAEASRIALMEYGNEVSACYCHCCCSWGDDEFALAPHGDCRPSHEHGCFAAGCWMRCGHTVAVSKPRRSENQSESCEMARL